MKVSIDVMLKDGILDPQGKTVEESLPSMGFEGVSGANPSLGTIVLNETHLHQVGAIIWQPRLLQDVFRWHRRRLDQTRRPLG